MKYIYKNTSLEVASWPKEAGEYFKILAFIHELFKREGKEISVDIPAPVIKFTNFHYATKQFTGCLDNENVIYLPEGKVGKELYASLITALVMYYGELSNQKDVGSTILDSVEVQMTITEAALTSPMVVAAVLLTKNVYHKIF